MRLLVGLGNPGPEYRDTRHNIGFNVLDNFIQSNFPDQSWSLNAKLKGYILKIGELIFLKPVTFMNLSGHAVKKVADIYKIEIQNIWVFQDEMDLPLGRIKIQKSGGSAGHNGIRSLIELLGSPEFIRWRIGVGKDATISGSEHVLGKFSTSEKETLSETIIKVSLSIQYALEHDLIATMNKYN